MTITEDMISAGIDAYYKCKNTERSTIYLVKSIYEAMSAKYYGEPKTWENQDEYELATSDLNLPKDYYVNQSEHEVVSSSHPSTQVPLNRPSSISNVNVPLTIHPNLKDYTDTSEADLDLLAAINLGMATGSGVTQNVDPVVYNTLLNKREES